MNHSDKNKTIRVVQLTDCHVSAKPDIAYRGINPRTNFESLLGPMRQLLPDLLLATGDLAEDGSHVAYAYLAGKLNSVAAPLITVPGNHDDFEKQKSVFPQTPIDQPLCVQKGNWQIIALNSSVKRQVSGSLDEAMLDGLDRLLEDTDSFKVIVLHHQPIVTGSDWIDKYALTEPEKFWSRLEERKDVKAVAWGHIHHEIKGMRGHIRLMGTPSTSANSVPLQKKFSFDPAGPACRLIELGPIGEVNTRLIRPA